MSTMPSTDTSFVRGMGETRHDAMIVDMQEDQPRQVRRAVIDWSFFGLGAFVGAVALAVALLVTRGALTLSSAGSACSAKPADACDLAPGISAIQIVVLSAAVITIVALTTALVRAVAGRSIWWISFAGTGLLAVIVTALNFSIVI